MVPAPLRLCGSEVETFLSRRLNFFSQTSDGRLNRNGVMYLMDLSSVAAPFEFSGLLLPAAFARLLRAAQRVRRLINACAGIVQVGAGIRANGIKCYTQFLRQQFVMLELRIESELIAGICTLLAADSSAPMKRRQFFASGLTSRLKAYSIGYYVCDLSQMFTFHLHPQSYHHDQYRRARLRSQCLADSHPGVSGPYS